MRIVHVASALVRKSAGVREVLLGLARAQSEAGADVTVLGLDHPDWAAEQHEWEGIRTRVVPVAGPLRRLGYSGKMTEALRALDPDIVHLHGLWMHPGRSVLQWHRATGKPYILSPHGMLSDVALSYGRSKKAAISWWFQDAVFASAERMHATSEAEVAEIRKKCIAAPVCVVPNGIADPGVQDYPATPGRTILSLGRIHRKKGLDFLIEAWSTLEADFPGWSVQIVGPDEGGEAARLKALIARLGVSRIALTGPVFGDEKLALMRRAGIFALPTRSENFALTVAESLILEVPVVASEGAPWAGLETERCGYWVPIGAAPMAEGLRRMMTLDDGERRQMGQRGRAWMLGAYSWQSVAGDLLKCYSQTQERTP